MSCQLAVTRAQSKPITAPVRARRQPSFHWPPNSETVEVDVGPSFRGGEPVDVILGGTVGAKVSRADVELTMAAMSPPRG